MVFKVQLIGLMGSGKSILGKLLASRLSLPLVDIDDLIVERVGKSIPEIFAQEGEAAFRQIESDVLMEVLAASGQQVVATGGGVVLAEKNRKVMKGNGAVIWLDASPEVLASRITGDANRPLLNNVDALLRMQALSEERNPLYAEVADFKVNTENNSDEEALASIIGFLSDYDA